MNSYYPRVVDKLREGGFTFLRVAKGSHEVWGRRGVHVIVPFNLQSRHTANEILKQAGVRFKF
jgi:predicted RNA binding protein YcfA (HicA-like mRNA interferase family)